MRRQGRSLLLATLLCILSLPLNATVARTLLPETLVQVLGLLLSIFLGFRYSQAYNRWWEARVLWGPPTYWLSHLPLRVPGCAEGDSR